VKIELEAIPRDYGFGLTIVVSAINSVDGAPVDGLTKSNFKVTAIQKPSGWSSGEVLKISSGVGEPSPGVYTFSLKSGTKKVPAGNYTLAVAVKGYKGWAPLFGQTLAVATMK
jgi:hypothetical protein